MVDYKWRADFDIVGFELKDPFVRDGLELTPGPTGSYTVNGTLRFSAPDEKTNALSFARQHVGALLNVLVTGLNLGFYSGCPQATRFSIELENMDDVIKSSQPIPNYPMLEEPPSSIDAKNLQVYFDGAKKIAISSAWQDFARITTHLRAGLSASDEYAKFYGVWRSLNAFCNFVDSTPSTDADKVRKFTRKVFDASMAQKIVDLYNKAVINYWGPMQIRLLYTVNQNVLAMLAGAGLKSRKGTVDFSAKLASSLKSASDPLETLEWALMCLYSVRNTVFHGSRYSYDDADFLYLCTLLLQEIVIDALNAQFVSKYAL